VNLRAGREGWSLRTRLMLAQCIVVGAGILTAALVAAIVGPELFHEHLLEAGQQPNSPELMHSEQAYASANAISLGAALVIALTAGFLVTWYLSRRMTQPLRDLATVATRLSNGDYSARAPRPSAGPELDRLADTLNDVAARLESTEDTRRRLLADLAHEMRTPLAVISLHLDGIEDGVTEWTPVTARVLRDHTERLVRLSADVADVSHADEGGLEGLSVDEIPVGELVRAAVEGVRSEFAAKGVALLDSEGLNGGTELARQGIRVAVDRQRILQLLTNVLANALRHTPAGGTVRVDARESGEAVEVTVSDTGDGISATHLPHIFERFYRGDTARDRDHGGSGIGLAIARSIAHAHHGTLTAASAGPGTGATFTLTLPAA